MTATATEHVAATAGATGRIARVIGPVVDVEFPADAIPAIYNALTTEITLNGETKTITFETSQHLGDNLVRAISLQATDGLVRGTTVVDSGSFITVPVGDGVKGHIFNVLGKPLDVAESEIEASD
jgi:F-type H+-transporting ATPase subunit beta